MKLQVLRHYACQLTLSAGQHLLVSKPLSSFSGNVSSFSRGICFGLFKLYSVALFWDIFHVGYCSRDSVICF